MLNRSRSYYDIADRLTLLGHYIENMGYVNLLDSHIHSETFYEGLFNLMYDRRLKNINSVLHNSPGIDLVDIHDRYVVSVSSTSTSAKVQAGLDRLSNIYAGYHYEFISISKDSANIRKKPYVTNGMQFDPKLDIHDIRSILRTIQGMDLPKLLQIQQYLENEIFTPLDQSKIYTDVAEIIGILSQTPLSDVDLSVRITPYDIEDKIMYNQLTMASYHINDCKEYGGIIDSVYRSHDEVAMNCSWVVLSTIRSFYTQSAHIAIADDRYEHVVHEVVKLVDTSTNRPEIRNDALLRYAHMIVADAFIRCKIFETPTGDPNAYS